MDTTWSKSLNIALFSLLLMLVGYQMAQSEKASAQMKRMEVMVAVCGDVAAFFAPDTDLDEMAELSRKRVVRR